MAYKGDLQPKADLRKLLIVEPDEAMQRSIQFFARSEVVALHVLNASIEPLNPPVGLGRSGPHLTKLDIQFSAELVELMLPRCYLLA